MEVINTLLIDKLVDVAESAHNMIESVNNYSIEQVTLNIQKYQAK